MYAGMDKYGGSVAGEVSTDGNSLDQAIETASAEETIVVNVPYDNTMVQVLLQSQLNPNGGGLMWIQADDTTATYNSVVSMSQMTSMLRDNDRNRKYALGIENAIRKFRHEHKRNPRVSCLFSS